MGKLNKLSKKITFSVKALCLVKIVLLFSNGLHNIPIKLSVYEIFAVKYQCPPKEKKDINKRKKNSFYRVVNLLELYLLKGYK